MPERFHVRDSKVPEISRCGVAMPDYTREQTARAAFTRDEQCRRRGCSDFWQAWNEGIDQGIADRNG